MLLLRQYIEHKNPDNLRIHVWLNAIFWAGWITLLSQVPIPVPIPLLGANLGALYVVASAVYWLAIDIGVPLLVILWSLFVAALPIVPWGPGHGWFSGVILPIATFTIAGLTAFYAHIYYHEHAGYLNTSDKTADALETAHAVFWGPFYFWLFALLRAGYRPRFRAELDEAERRRILRIDGLAWNNWCGNVHCRPRIACVPLTLDDLSDIVRSASRDGRKLRLVGSGFNLSAMVATDDTLVFCERLHGVAVSSDRRTAWVECGTTNRQLNKALAAEGLQLPWNVVLENVMLGAVVTVGTHGSGKDTATMGDLVEAFDVIDANGNRRILSEKTIGTEGMTAARLAFGTFGVIARVQLRVEPACRVLQIDRRVTIEQALAELPHLVRNQDSVELFWFAFTDWIWIRTFERTEQPVTFNGHGLLFLARNFLDMMFLVGVISVASKCFPKRIPWILRQCASQLPFQKRVLPLTDALHYRRWLELKRTACVEVGFKMDERLANFNKAFEGTVRLVNEWGQKGHFPLDLTINVRFTGPSRALLSPAYGPGLTCFIEALFTQRSPEWKVFTSELYALWMSATPNALPHWAKEFEHVPGIDLVVRERLGSRLTRFLDTLQESGIDPNGMFVNELVRRVFFEPTRSELG
jgi:hypothetical protein